MFVRAVLAVLIVLAAAGPAIAQQPDTLQRAQSLFDEAQQKYVAKDYGGAAEKFKEAYAARPLPSFLYNAAAAYHMQGKTKSDVAAYQLAVQYYQKFLTDEPKTTDKATIDKSIAVLTAEIARLKPAAGAPVPEATPSAEVTALGDVATRSLVVIETEPQGANIYLDDKKNGVFAQTPWSGSLDGPHTVLIEKRGHKSKESMIAPDPNRLVVLQVVLSEEDYLGWVEIRSNVPGAAVYSDDKASGAIGKTPYSGNFKPGKHTIWVDADGYDEHTEQLEVIAGETHEINATLSGSPVGYLNIRGAGLERARVLVDGSVVCEKGPCRTPVKEGNRAIVVSRSGYKPYRTRLDLQARTEVTIVPQLAEKPGRGDAVVAYVFTAVLAGGATGAYFYQKGLEPTDTYYDKRKYIRYGAYGGWGLAGVIGLSAIYYTFRDKGAPSSGQIDVKALALQPVVGSDFAGLSVGGGF